MFIYLQEGVHLIGKNCEGMYRVYAGSSPAHLPKFQGVSPSNYVIEVRDYNLKRLLVKSSKRLGNREGGNGGSNPPSPQNRDGFCWRLTRNVNRMCACRLV